MSHWLAQLAVGVLCGYIGAVCGQLVRLCTVSASILGSFDFVVALFTPPAKAPVMLAAAHERLADAPRGAAPHRSVEGMVDFAPNMLSGATWRSGRLR